MENRLLELGPDQIGSVDRQVPGVVIHLPPPVIQEPNAAIGLLKHTRDVHDIGAASIKAGHVLVPIGAQQLIVRVFI